jgi:hypothetical protein
MLVQAPYKTPFGHDNVVACGNPVGNDSHTWGTFVGTTLRRGITSVTTSPLIVPHEWCGGMVVTQKELTALSPSSPPPPYMPPGYVVSPPPLLVSPPPPPTSPPLPQGYSTPGQPLAVDAVAAGSITAVRLFLVAPDGSKLMLTTTDGSTLTTTDI